MRGHEFNHDYCLCNFVKISRFEVVGFWCEVNSKLDPSASGGTVWLSGMLSLAEASPGVIPMTTDPYPSTCSC